MSSEGNGKAPSGAYGFRLVLAESEFELPDLVPLDGSEQDVAVSLRFACPLADSRLVENDRVTLKKRNGAGIYVEREPASVHLDMPVEVSPGALVHPLLTIPLSVLARWRGNVTLHGGAFSHDGGAWGVLGERTAGKSSMLGVLGQRGIPIAADDLLVIDGGSVRAGPRCVDLRPDVAEHLPDARYLGMVGNRPRYRLATPAAPARLPLRGIFVLEWHDAPEPAVVPMSTPERLEVLYRHASMALMGFADPESALTLLGLPMWRFRRKADWESTPAAVAALLDAASAQASP